MLGRMVERAFVISVLSVYTSSKKMNRMNTLWNYMNTVWNYIFNHVEYLSVIEPPSPPSPRSMEFCYDCGNYLCVNTTKDISNWKLVTKKTRNYYFCKDECWEEWLQEYQ